MLVNTETSQEFLELIYDIQNNGNYAVSIIQRVAGKLQNKKVYKAYDWTKNKCVYSLQPIQDITEENEAVYDLGGRPKSLTDKQVQEILSDDRPHRELARVYNVSEGTIRNVRKQK